MAQIDLEGARAALRDAMPGSLLGLPECEWLDAKNGVYRLDQPDGAEEFIKDVAAFANAPNGGLIVVGVKTRVKHGEEILDRLRPIPRSMVDLDQHRKIIRDRVMPPPRGVRVEWCECGDDKGLLVVDVPKQPASHLPFAVPGPSRTAKPSCLSVAVPIREADGTYWLPQTEIRRILSVGWSETGGPTNDILKTLVTKTLSEASQSDRAAPTGYEIGQGNQIYIRSFRDMYNALGGPSLLGRPISEAYRHGPGVTQHFAGSGNQGWTLCVLPDHQPVAVPDSIWQALQNSGSAAQGPATSFLGFPYLGTDIPHSARRISEQDTRVELKGGTWGGGRLTRADAHENWLWEPHVGIYSRMSKAVRKWMGLGASEPHFRMRAVSSLPWAAQGLSIDPESRRELLKYLPRSILAESVAAILQRYGSTLRADDWGRGPNRQARDSASYICTFSTPDGKTALSIEVMVTAPNRLDPAVTTCAELRIEDAPAWTDALDATGEKSTTATPKSISPRDLITFLNAAWETATEILPWIVSGDPFAMRFTGPPTVELFVGTNPLKETKKQLGDWVDLSAFGESDQANLTEMSAMLVAPPLMDHEWRKQLTRWGVVSMAQDAGFIDASEDDVPLPC